MSAPYPVSLPACLEMWPGWSVERRANLFRLSIIGHCQRLADVAEDAESTLVLLGGEASTDENAKQMATLVDEIHECGEACDVWADALEMSDADLVTFVESIHAQRSAA